MSTSQILWVYVGLLLVGGIMGWVKAKSKMSLIASTGFAILLALCALGTIADPIVPKILLGLLLVVFGMRLAKTKKFMPAGMMLIVTALALGALLMK